MEKSSKKDIKKFEENKLERLLLHACKNVPYYSKVLEKSKVIEGGRVNLKNFNKIPILTKEIIKKEGENLYSKDYKKRKFYKNSTGGSSGIPINFIQDKNYEDWNIGNKIYYKTFGGQHIGDLEIRLWGSERDILRSKESLSIKLINWLYNRKEFNSFLMTKEKMQFFIEQLNTQKPKWIEAYAHSIYELAKFVKENRLKVHSPNGILTSSGTLYSKMKELIEDVFQTKVFNRYGSREVGDIACSCEQGYELHVSIWNNFIEILDDDHAPVKPGCPGKIYVTNLNNYSMPFIRYDIGDIAVRSEKRQCPCGRKTPLLKGVEGRITNVFRTKQGTIITPEFFIHFLGVVYNKGFISQFQVIQKDFDSIIIKVIVEDQRNFNRYKSRIENCFKEVMGKTCKIQWEFVDEIEYLKTGKFPYVLSEIEKN